MTAQEKEIVETVGDQMYVYKPPFEAAWERTNSDGVKMYESVELVSDEDSPSGYAWNYTVYEDTLVSPHRANYGRRYDEYDGALMYGYESALEAAEELFMFDDDYWGKRVEVDPFVIDGLLELTNDIGECLHMYTFSSLYPKDTPFAKEDEVSAAAKAKADAVLSTYKGLMTDQARAEFVLSTLATGVPDNTYANLTAEHLARLAGEQLGSSFSRALDSALTAERHSGECMDSPAEEAKRIASELYSERIEALKSTPPSEASQAR